MNKTLKIFGSVTIVVIIAILILSNKTPKGEIKIGIVTPLTGGVAYWGESTSVGFKMAQEELLAEGIKVKLVIEDGQLDPVKALNAAQKLVNIDNVSAIYSEFNPASIAISSFLKDKNVFHLYDSAAMSPIKDGPYNFKTYLDYKDSCAEVAKYIKENNGVSKVGVLKMNIEHGNLCLEGVLSVFGNENVISESYNPGVTDFRSSISKISSAKADAIFHASFQPETLASLKQLNEFGVNKLFIGLAETITPDITNEYSTLIQNDIFFGLPEINKTLQNKIDQANDGKAVADYNAAGLGYVHILQLGHALNDCGKDSACIATKMASSKPVESIGFQGFRDRIAKFNNRITQFVGNSFVEIK